ncbi:hypothetical protein Bca4012_021415 [Brassica carinata]|uniref:FBD domain-containing protein n=1 Tax=Brassica carinata TaxID=52824 RepID=A0A8X7WGN9_BRACI|nr:hypothetical protein Bca52824_000147 [Brassica carinata]
MDRISGLSDELLLKILLLVPTKVAVSTSILSKRWEYLWMWLPKLDYGHFDCSKSEWERLRCFLDRNLPLHRAPVIESFRLRSCRQHVKPENVSMWVSTAVYHCVRELDILHDHTDPAMPDILPCNLFTSKSLVILKLVGEILLDVPRMVSLPSLKTLKLQSVRYFRDETLQRLLSNCPVLEDLVVDLGLRDTTRKLTIVVPSLLSLSFYIPCSNDIDGYVIETPALKHFKLWDYNYKSHYCLIEHMPNLIEAHLDVELPDISGLIPSISSVKHLTICSQAMLDEGFAFNQLEHLELCTCKEHSPSQLIRLLKASSNLKGLHLLAMEDDHDDNPHRMEEWNQPSIVPDCLLSSLQSLTWSKYTGEPKERDVVVYILKHALHLKTATITPTQSDVTELEMLKEFSRSSRASTTCELMFD